MEFILANWQLFAGVVLVVILLLTTSGMAAFGSLIPATPAEVVQMLNQQQARVFDLRGEEKFAAGHLADSRHVTTDNLAVLIKKVTRPDEQPVVLVSERGVATTAVVKQLKAAGFQRIYELKGGVDAWREAQLPLVKS